MNRSNRSALRLLWLAPPILLSMTSSGCFPKTPPTPNKVEDAGIARQPNRSEWCGVEQLAHMVRERKTQELKTGLEDPGAEMSSDALSWLVGHVQRSGAIPVPGSVSCAS